MRVTVKYDTPGGATIHVLDSLSNASIGELRRAVERVRREGFFPVVNLAELTLADRSSLQYLATLRSEGVRLDDCPSYVDLWINKLFDGTESDGRRQANI
jgi:hypothetical protein